jgi:cell division inhibitor SepF
MGFSDSWHRTLVYFGLAEDRDAYEEEEEQPAAIRAPEAELEDRYRERPNVRRLSTRRRRDEIDDIFADESPSERRTNVLRPVGGRPANGRSGEVRVHLVIPKSFNDAQDVADKFKDSIRGAQLRGARAADREGLLQPELSGRAGAAPRGARPRLPRPAS